MKTRYWIALLSVTLAACIGWSVYIFLPKDSAAFAAVTSYGETVKTVSLGIDQEFTVTTPSGGSNTVTVRDGKIGVTAANCPDGYCMQRGFCNQGTQIVCLPNHLIISFSGGMPSVDAIAG